MPRVPAKKQKTPACIRKIQVHKLWTKVYSQQGLAAMHNVCSIDEIGAPTHVHSGDKIGAPTNVHSIDEIGAPTHVHSGDKIGAHTNVHSIDEIGAMM